MRGEGGGDSHREGRGDSHRLTLFSVEEQEWPDMLRRTGSDPTGESKREAQESDVLQASAVRPRSKKK